jgi:hypothetical protein
MITEILLKVALNIMTPTLDFWNQGRSHSDTLHSPMVSEEYQSVISRGLTTMLSNMIKPVCCSLKVLLTYP